MDRNIWILCGISPFCIRFWEISFLYCDNFGRSTSQVMGRKIFVYTLKMNAWKHLTELLFMIMEIGFWELLFL